MEQIDWRPWVTHFERHRGRPLPPVQHCAEGLEPRQQRALASSLARFELGERGGGSIARRIDHLHLTGIDDHYRSALKLFVAEEHRHGQILARLVRTMGGQLLDESWTDSLFTRGRRLMGLRVKLLVLLSAEVIGIAFYGGIAAVLPPGSARTALEGICEDEEAHLRFHRDFFCQQSRTPLARALVRAGLWVIGLAAMATVVADHRRQMAALGLSPRQVAQRMVGLLAESSTALSRPPVAAGGPSGLSNFRNPRPRNQPTAPSTMEG